MPEQVNDLFAKQDEQESVNYVLTNKRNLLRVLDIGLITPELVACTAAGKLAVSIYQCAECYLRFRSSFLV